MTIGIMSTVPATTPIIADNNNVSITDKYTQLHLDNKTKHKEQYAHLTRLIS